MFVTGTIKEHIKSVLKLLRLYKPAVYVYCMLEAMYVKAGDLFQYLCSPVVNTRYKSQGVTDGLPFPPIRLVYLVTNTYRYDWFFESGVLGAQSIRDVLKKNSRDISEFGAILDFGCGCGRMMRHWKTLRGPSLFGTDYNSVLVDWSRENLSFAEFAVNGLATGLIYEDEKFDFVYAISVFTHLTEELGFFWIKELYRVLKPGGVMYITFMGTTRAPHLRQELREQYEAGHLVVTGEEHQGKNVCAAYHPEQYVRNILAKEYRILDFVPGGARDANQDVFLLQKVMLPQ